MTPEQEIKDLKLQLEVVKQLSFERFSELEDAREYIRGCKALLDDMGVPLLDGVLQTRLHWIRLNMHTAQEWVARLS